MREVLRYKLVATSLCAGPYRIAYAYPRGKQVSAPPRGCLCGSAERHVAQLAECPTDRRQHAV
jgi:hypothetical protein